MLKHKLTKNQAKNKCVKTILNTKISSAQVLVQKKVINNLRSSIF